MQLSVRPLVSCKTAPNPFSIPLVRLRERTEIIMRCRSVSDLMLPNFSGMNRLNVFLIIFYLTIGTGVKLLAQGNPAAHNGDEAEMSNKARERDQQAIDEAVNGWWSQSMKIHDRRIQWWKDARFGMFIHWGIYSLPGGEWKGHKVGGYAEHLMRKEKISRAD